MSVSIAPAARIGARAQLALVCSISCLPRTHPFMSMWQYPFLAVLGVNFCRKSAAVIAPARPPVEILLVSATLDASFLAYGFHSGSRQVGSRASSEWRAISAASSSSSVNTPGRSQPSATRCAPVRVVRSSSSSGSWTEHSPERDSGARGIRRGEGVKGSVRALERECAIVLVGSRLLHVPLRRRARARQQ